MERDAIKYILTNKHNDDDIFLFHYTSLDACCSIIESKRLRMGNLANTNDPLEFCGFPSPYFIGNNETSDIYEKYKENRKAQDLRNKAVRILCFCQDFTCKELREGKYTQTFADNLLCKGWARVRMWAQYADNHKGACLIFDKAKFQQQFKKLKKNDVRLKEQKITYTNIFADFESIMTPKITEADQAKDFSEFYLDEKRLSFLFKKCEDFHDENEYRFCIIDKTLKSCDKIVSVDIGDSLKAVVLGERVSHAIRIKPLFGNPIEQFRIKWNFGMPELF